MEEKTREAVVWDEDEGEGEGDDSDEEEEEEEEYSDGEKASDEEGASEGDSAATNATNAKRTAIVMHWMEEAIIIYIVVFGNTGIIYILMI